MRPNHSRCFVLVDHIKVPSWQCAEDEWSGRITIVACLCFVRLGGFTWSPQKKTWQRMFPAVRGIQHRDTKIWFEYEVQLHLGLMCSSIISSSNSVTVDSVDERFGRITRVAGVCFVRLNSFTYHQGRKQDAEWSKYSQGHRILSNWGATPIRFHTVVNHFK